MKGLNIKKNRREKVNKKWGKKNLKISHYTNQKKINKNNNLITLETITHTKSLAWPGCQSFNKLYTKIPIIIQYKYKTEINKKRNTFKKQITKKTQAHTHNQDLFAQ